MADLNKITSDYNDIIDRFKNGCHPLIAIKDAYLAGFDEGLQQGMQIVQQSVVNLINGKTRESCCTESVDSGAGVNAPDASPLPPDISPTPH